PLFLSLKSGKWRLLIDLREVNKRLELMGSLQPGLPNPSLILQHWNITIIDLKDCFFTIPLQDKDKVLFVFTIPEYNYGKPTQRYQWKVLPQGILNSPTLCQEFVDRALQPVRTQYPSML
ncbi:POK25 protein, partial [Crocuta crocuta]